ncbi:Fur family transcriptional regulator [Zobellia roscoffensis]
MLRYICTMGIVRRTKSVDAILEEFKMNSGAISVVSLVDQLSSRFNKTTVYRVLDRLEEDGILHSFLGKTGIKWYAKCSGCSASEHHDVHPHFQCLSCGKVDCLTVNVRIPSIPNRKVEASQILLQGQCEACLV